MNQRRLAVFITVLALACSSSNSSSPGTGEEASAQKLASLPTSKAAKMSAIYDTAATLTDQEKRVPHYFGPFPNWANSPFTFGDAKVTITDPTGAGATAEAVIGANGAVTAINVTAAGSNYSATPTILVTRADGTTTGTTAVSASAKVDTTGSVTGVSVSSGGTGYTAPSVVISGTGGTGATATAYGRVEQVTVTVAGSGYTTPTVDFDMPDFADGVRARAHATIDASGAITGVIMDDMGSGYAKAPKIVIRNGTIFKPVAMNSGAVLASASATLTISQVAIDKGGTGYHDAVVIINDATKACDTASPSPGCAVATATVNYGGIAEIVVSAGGGGSGYVTKGGIQKFVDTLPGLTPTAPFNLTDYIPVAVADTTTFPKTATADAADYYEIAVVEYTQQMHRDLPPTKLRGYVQLSTSVVPGKHVALANADGTPILLPNGSQAYGVDQPHYLGPTIVAQRNRPVRITFYNLLPTGAKGNLFLPVDSTIMGSGMGQMNEPFNMTPTAGGTVFDDVRNPHCTGLMYDATTKVWMVHPKDGAMCFTDNRATLHLHGGNTPWISDGTPHQWLTPRTEATSWRKGMSVKDVPDMVGAAKPALVPNCSAADAGCMTFYYTNQQSARLMFYHDHAWGITRLNVYAGEAAGYLIQDETEKSLISRGLIPADQIPLIIQDRTFVPSANQLSWQDPTWDAARWGTAGSLWYHHVYMPAQNPSDPGGMSAFGRWMYGPWFWPPAIDIKYPPIANPYFSATCRLDNPVTWQYQTDPFCEPALIPGTPNISAGMEQFNDTPIVNGKAYPTVTLEPRSYRFRILNAANDRFWNLQWYVADATGTEVALKASELLAAQTDPVVFPTPKTAPDPTITGDLNYSPPGPDWIQIGTEGGFLPAPVVIPPQPITWITDPTRFDVGNVDLHSLALAPAERADVIVDFSQYAGKTLILYNDAPAAYPARVPSYDYYTGAPDLSPVGAPKILPGYGPNTRTVMQVKIAGSAGTPFDLKALQAAFRHQADGSGVFESGQHPIIVGQAAYNTAYGTAFAAGSWCNGPTPTAPCDGFLRINEQGGDNFKFDTLLGDKLSIPIQPKAIHDEMNASSYDEFGRMTANLGVEAVPATPGLQNINLFPYTMPPTEVLDTTYLPKITFDVNGVEMKVTPISVANDGTQIWKITHNGVDTHPIHFHAFDVQLLNRVTWDNIVMPPEPNELGWKDTVRVSPLQDTIFALRAVIPKLPWELPNSVRRLDPMRPTLTYQSDANGPIQPAIDIANQLGTYGKYIMASSTLNDPTGLPIVAGPNGEPIDVYNHVMNFGAEYVYHCHILSHEEMDMMRPVVLAYPPKTPEIVSYASNTRYLSWKDNSIAETAYSIQARGDTTAWREVYRIERSLTAPNTTGTITTRLPAASPSDNTLRIVAENKVGDWWDYGQPAGLNEGTVFPTATATSVSTELKWR